MTKKILYWTPRIIGILAILFMMLFSLDCFTPENVFIDQLRCFFMHNIPAFITLLVLIMAWKWELIGGILFIAVFFAGGIFFHGFSTNPYSLIVMAPFLLTGLLFVLSYFLFGNKNKLKSVSG